MRQFACPACGAANRTPAGKDPLSAKWNGRLVARTAGLTNTAQIVAWTRQALAQASSGAASGDQS
ncbi:MAG: hypothetical protein EPO51_05170 [Phenylobacterium sp.]|uniref:hypothetical protein n=1 Tax=Phenylobacterium sp. TaxID=1871053 RepID=UPI00120969FC|nr:hypothetical protein [Phenylobacterium sp.]TAJ73395.1 MAG: hypothetical protein EPO51_05170 [Phenylobacterium sp.]